MKKIIRLFAFFLIVAVLFGCWGCAGEATTTEAPTETDAPTAPPTDPPTQPPNDTSEEPPTETKDPHEGWEADPNVTLRVIEGYSGTATTQLHNEKSSYSIPRIQPVSKREDGEAYDAFVPYIDDVNTEICNTYLLHVDEYLDIHYETYQNDRFLTLIITATPDITGVTWDDLSIYTIDLAQQRAASRDEILQSAGLTEDAFAQKAQAALVQAYWAFRENIGASTEPPTEESVENTTAERLSHAFPFFGADGALQVCGFMYMDGGQGIWLTTAPLSME